MLVAWETTAANCPAGLGLQSGRRGRGLARRAGGLEGGKVGRAWGSLPPGGLHGLPFVAALATMRGSGAGDRPNLGRNTWEGGESRTHNPSHQSRQPAHAHPCHTLPNQPIRGFRPAYQPVFPVSKNTNERERTRSSLVGLVCPSVSLFCPSLWPIVFFSSPFAIPYLACSTCIQHLHSSRLLHFASCSIPSARLPSAHTLTHRIASRLSLRPLFARPTQ